MENNTMNSLLCVLRAFRNGSFYGTKIRAPHALVMIFLFRQGSVQDKLRQVVKLTYEHSRNLAVFVGVYKASLELLRMIHNSHQLTPSAYFGKPALGWHAAVAGALGGYCVWAKYSSVNYQIIMYLLSRILISQAKLLAKSGRQPFAQYNFQQVYPVLAVSVWGVVMWLFENHGELLHPSLFKSMEFLYHDSNQWPNGIQDFLPSPATAVVCLATWLQL